MSEKLFLFMIHKHMCILKDSIFLIYERVVIKALKMEFFRLKSFTNEIVGFLFNESIAVDPEVLGH